MIAPKPGGWMPRSSYLRTVKKEEKVAAYELALLEIANLRHDPDGELIDAVELAEEALEEWSKV